MRRSKKANRSPAPPPRIGGKAVDRYWSAVKTPLHSLLFLLPMVAFYEIGIIQVNQGQIVQVRNGPDVMLRRLVALAGRPGIAASAFILVAVLLLWQAIGKYPWKVRFGVFPLMLLECVVWALVLYVFATLWSGQTLAVPGAAAPETPPAGVTQLPWNVRLVLSFGAGIYEELVFRLLLVGVLMAIIGKGMGLERTRAALWAVGISALVFAIAHYVGPMGEPFRISAHWGAFLFRFIAGVIFSVVLAFRGFGVVAGAHALYDVAATVL